MHKYTKSVFKNGLKMFLDSHLILKDRIKLEHSKNDI